jgi:hypothetical protein
LIEKLGEQTDPEKTLGKVGSEWKGSAPGYTSSTLRILENNDGDVVCSFTYQGVTRNIQGRITDKAIYDYVYSNGDTKKPFTLVRFDANVGDKWEYNVGNQKVVREVKKKSIDDDYSYGFMLIKTIDVEETIPSGTLVAGKESQISKILWNFNHKFGFVGATITKKDGTTVKVY